MLLLTVIIIFVTLLFKNDNQVYAASTAAVYKGVDY